MGGRLTTHVLDTAHGCPATNVAIELWRIQSAHNARELVTRTQTNSDGRTDGPLLVDAAFTKGVYELIFMVGQYFKQFEQQSTPPFLDQVPVRFTITNAEAHYHIPLLASPWAYSTYRGS